MGVWFIPIWVGDPQSCKDAPLKRFHGDRLFIGFVIIAQKVQDSMNE